MKVALKTNFSPFEHCRSVFFVYRNVTAKKKDQHHSFTGNVQLINVIFFSICLSDQSCSVFYGPDKYSPLKLGVCDIGSRSCKCSQGK